MGDALVPVKAERRIGSEGKITYDVSLSHRLGGEVLITLSRLGLDEAKALTDAAQVIVTVTMKHGARPGFDPSLSTHPGNDVELRLWTEP